MSDLPADIEKPNGSLETRKAGESPDSDGKHASKVQVNEVTEPDGQLATTSIKKEDGQNEPAIFPSAASAAVKLENGDPEANAINSVLDLDLDLDGALGSDPPTALSDNDYTRDSGEEQRRVKVYELIDNKWTDRGTAFCQSAYDEEKQMAKLVARSEDNPDDIILQFFIRGEDVYQRQQETLIVWTEPDGTDYALSFQDIEGCTDVWDYILDVQRAINGEKDRDENEELMSSSPPTRGRPVTFTSIVQASQLPPPQFGIMMEVERAIKHVGRNINHRDRLCEHIIGTDYVRLMIDLAAQAEDLEQLEDLHALCACMQSILLLNDHTIFEHVTSDPLFLGVCGILEYDPEFPMHKACYREMLSQQSQFKQPIPFNDETVRRKVHQTYRLQFLKDVVLTRVMEDSTFNVLNSCIIFNQIDLINHFQADETFLRAIIRLFPVIGDLQPPQCDERPDPPRQTSPAEAHDQGDNESSMRRKDVIFLIQQLCVMGKNVQLQARLLLFRSLVDRGFIQAVQWGLSQTDVTVVSTSAEILGALLEHDTNGVRQHVMKQAETGPDDSNTLLHIISTALTLGKGDVALKSQLADCLKALLETLPPDGSDTTAVTGIKALIRQREDPISEKFLEYIYKNGCVKQLFKPLIELPDPSVPKESHPHVAGEKTTVYFFLAELLCAMVQQHGFRSVHFVLESSISRRIAFLLSLREKHIRLVAMRFFRACLKLNNRTIVNHLVKHNIPQPILELTKSESNRDNLLSSTCQEFFEHVRKENFKELIEHVMSKHADEIKTLAASPVVGARFKNFIRRWEQNTEPPPNVLSEEKPSNSPSNRRWSQGRGMESEEEDWFHEPEDAATTAGPPWGQQQPSVPKLKRKRGAQSGGKLEWPSRKRQQPTPTPVNSPKLPGLVDYEDEEGNPAQSAGTSKTLDGANKVSIQAPLPIKLPFLDSSTELLLDADDSSEDGVLDDFPKRLEKRRRVDEEEEEGVLERLASKAIKRPTLSDPKEKERLGPVKSPTFKLKLSSSHLPDFDHLGANKQSESGDVNKDDAG